VRTLQAHALLRAARAFAAEAAAATSPAPAFVLCGDLNAEPHDGALRYLSSGALGAGDPEWAQAAPFSWGLQRGCG
jgi:endonuclease/exonuclease/phosphatase family metal-dependent hydrolase